MKFRYKGMLFEPYRKLIGKEADFFIVSKKLSTKDSLTPEGWNWQDFYKAAVKSNKDNAEIDLFKHKNLIVIPAQNYLFTYVE